MFDRDEDFSEDFTDEENYRENVHSPVRRSREDREDKIKAPKTSKKKAASGEPEFVTRGGHEFALLEWGLETNTEPQSKKSAPPPEPEAPEPEAAEP